MAETKLNLANVAEEAFALNAENAAQAIDNLPQKLGSLAQGAGHIIFILCSPSGIGHSQPPLFNLYEHESQERGDDLLLVAQNGAKLGITRTNKLQLDHERYELVSTSVNGFKAKTVHSIDGALPLPSEDAMIERIVQWASRNCPIEKKSHFIDLMKGAQTLIEQDRADDAIAQQDDYGRPAIGQEIQKKFG